jgi:hypothetical protein
VPRGCRFIAKRQPPNRLETGCWSHGQRVPALLLLWASGRWSGRRRPPLPELSHGTPTPRARAPGVARPPQSGPHGGGPQQRPASRQKQAHTSAACDTPAVDDSEHAGRGSTHARLSRTKRQRSPRLASRPGLRPLKQREQYSLTPPAWQQTQECRRCFVATGIGLKTWQVSVAGEIELDGPPDGASRILLRRPCNRRGLLWSDRTGLPVARVVGACTPLIESPAAASSRGSS